jgi:predicted TPR repeat methyltransferase/thioredoxin-like negative regulator of GroEL
MTALVATADGATIVRRGRELLAAGRLGAAKPLLAAAHNLLGMTTEVAELAAQTAMAEGRHDLALQVLDGAIRQAPSHVSLRLARAELLWHQGDLPGATCDAAEAVVAQPDSHQSKALLGMLMLELRRPAEAIACLKEAVAAAPASAAYREALATAYETSGAVDDALSVLADGIRLAPACVSLRNVAILIHIRQRNFLAAVAAAEYGRAAGVADACTFGLMGHALSSLGQHEKATAAYREALKLGPDDQYVRHLVTASGLLPGAKRAPDDYLIAVFDGYADRFESHLLALGYRIPGVIRRVVMTHPLIAAGQTLGPVLDLGCGTGFLGVALGGLAIAPLIGVDISARMLAQARAKQIYAELHEASIGDFLAADATRWPLMLAADVLCYFGELDAVIAAVHARLAPGGWFVFSLEQLPAGDDWALQRQGRYAHAPGYVERTAAQAGFTICRIMPEVIRYEAGAPVEGMIVVLERTRHDG